MTRIDPRTGALFGWGAVTFWVVLYTVAALSTPGYSIPGNRLSDLGNPAEPRPWAFNSGCILAGVFFVPFAWTLRTGTRPWTRRVDRVLLSSAGIALVLLGVFHEGSPYDLHFIFSGLFFILFTMAISHGAVAMWRNPRYGRISGALGALASGLALAFIVAVLLEAVSNTSIAGGVLSDVLEHATAFAGLAWVAWNGLRLYRIPQPETTF